MLGTAAPVAAEAIHAITRQRLVSRIDAAIDEANAIPGVGGTRAWAIRRIRRGRIATVEINVVEVVLAIRIELAQTFEAAAGIPSFGRLQHGDPDAELGELPRPPLDELLLQRARQRLRRDVDGDDFRAHHEIAARIAIELGAMLVEQLPGTQCARGRELA